MRRYPVKLVSGTRLSKVSKAGTNSAELSGDEKAVKARKLLSSYMWSLVPKKNQETL